MFGAPATMDSVIPVRTVIEGGTRQPGLTMVWKVPRHSPPWKRAPPTSVMEQLRGEVPVVSRSSTQKVTSESGVPRSSKFRWIYASGELSHGTANMVLMACDNPDVPLVIDCDTCSRQGTTTCEDCVVTFLREHPPDQAVVVDLDEYRALRLLGDAGLVPPLRHSHPFPMG